MLAPVYRVLDPTTSIHLNVAPDVRLTLERGTIEAAAEPLIVP